MSKNDFNKYVSKNKNKNNNCYGYVNDSNISTYLKDICLYDLLDKDDEVSYFEYYEKHRDVYTRNNIVNANLKLVVSIANRFVNNGIDLLDLIQEGNIGLTRAVEKFSTKIKVRFATYATFFIKHKILRLFKNTGNTIRIPVYILDKIISIDRFKCKFIEKNMIEPTDIEISKLMNISMNDIKTCNNAFNTMCNIDDNDNTIESLDNNNDISIINKINIDQSSIIIIDLLNNLIDDDIIKNKHINMIKYRFGFVDNTYHTLEETGKKFNLSRERIRQIQNIIIEKLKNNSNINILRDLYNEI